MKEEYIVRKTSPKKGLPNGGWVCYNFSIDEHLKAYGLTALEALEKYTNIDEVNPRVACHELGKHCDKEIIDLDPITPTELIEKPTK
jgi:hypothetical protein